MRAHLVQLDIAWEDKSANHSRVDALLEPIEIVRDDLIVLPEMFDTGFSMHVEKTNDHDDASLGYCAALASRAGAYVHGGRTVLQEDGWARNRATVHAPDGSLILEYDKIHPFSFGKEPERFKGGDRIATWVWTVGGESLRVCPAVCYDLRFPELFRMGLTRGAEVFVIGANWPRARAEHWRTLLIARAIENQAWVIGVNRAGKDPYLEYTGGSVVVDPTGRIAGDAGEMEGILSVEVKRGPLDEWRGRFPAWQDRKL